MKTVNVIKPAVLALLTLSATCAYADTQDYNASRQTSAAAVAVPDDTITANVKTKIAQQFPTITVEGTQAGVVTLSGMIDSQAQAENVAQMVKSVNGVKDVKSMITIQVPAK